MANPVWLRLPKGKTGKVKQHHHPLMMATPRGDQFAALGSLWPPPSLAHYCFSLWPANYWSVVRSRSSTGITTQDPSSLFGFLSLAPSSNQNHNHSLLPVASPGPARQVQHTARGSQRMDPLLVLPRNTCRKTNVPVQDSSTELLAAIHYISRAVSIF
jgi:hypothetical protein